MGIWTSDSSVTTAASCRPKQSFHSQYGVSHYCGVCPPLSPALLCVLGALFTGLQGPGYTADYSPPSCIVVKNEYSCTCTTHTILSDFTLPHKLLTIALNYGKLKPNSYSLTLTVEATVSSKTWVRFYQTTRRYIAHDDIVRTQWNFSMFCTCIWELNWMFRDYFLEKA